MMLLARTGVHSSIVRNAAVMARHCASLPTLHPAQALLHLGSHVSDVLAESIFLLLTLLIIFY
jgi:hypothetical protein